MAVVAVDFVDMASGKEALAAAAGYAAILLFFTSSISIALAIAAGWLVARGIGAGEALAELPLVPGFLGAEGEGTRLASRYLWIPLSSVPVMSPAMIAMTVLRAHGVARRPMLARHSGGLLNALLDPILIFGVGLGLEEAALA